MLVMHVILGDISTSRCGWMDLGAGCALKQRISKSSGMGLERIARLFVDGPIPLIRTDFSADAAWHRVVEEVSREVDFAGDGDSYTPSLEAISDAGFDSIAAEILASAWPREHHGYVILADHRSMREATSGGELTVVFVDLSADEEDEEEFGWAVDQAFRCMASEVASIEANLSIANMDFPDFADAVEDDGVFRGHTKFAQRLLCRSGANGS